MDRIRGLELLFNLEKKNLKSKEDCVVAVFHCLFINRGYQCAGKGDEWPESTSTTTELLPADWNSNQTVYALRYITVDKKSRVLLKVTKMEHILQADVVMNEDAVASMSVPVENHIDNYDEYCTAYKDLKTLSETFSSDVMQKLQPTEAKKTPSPGQSTREPASVVTPTAPLRMPPSCLQEDRNQTGFPPRLPNIGGRDLNPFGSGGGMLMGPSDFGVPDGRPTLPQFGVGGPGGLPRGAVPPGARFDPFMPPNFRGRFQPDADHMRPPDYDDFM